MVLNALLIFTIVVGVAGLERVEYCRSTTYIENGKAINIAEDNLYGNTDLQNEFKEALIDVLSYVLEESCLENSDANQKRLEQDKQNLDNKWTNYKYNISYTTIDGKEKVITNSSETEEQLTELPIAISDKERLPSDYSYYSGDVDNFYNGRESFFEWFHTENLVGDICIDNQEYSALVSKQIIEHMDFQDYKDILLETAWRADGTKIRKKIAKNDAKKNYGLTEEEVAQLCDWMYSDILTGEIEYQDIALPLSLLMDSPERYHITFAIDKEYYASAQAPYRKYQDEMENRQQMLHILTYVLFYDIAAFVIVMLTLLYVCGNREDSDEIHYLALDKCHVEIELLAEAVLYAGLVYYYDNYWTVAFGILKSVTMALVPIVMIWIMVQILFSLVRQLKGQQILENSFIVHILKRIGRFFETLLQSGKLTIISVAMAIVLPIFYAILIFIEVYLYIWYCYDVWESFLVVFFLIFLICNWLAIIVLTYKKTREFKTIYEGVEKVKSGDIKYQIKVNGSGMMHDLAENINSLSDGLEDAVNEMMKSERLKTELISNVSHDIKTPLTSIITYVDLLKKEEVQPEKALEYIDVLDRKSQRLKYLIEDLFEAAKASSGDMSMELVTLDAGSLVNQGIGEFTEKFEKSNLLVKNNVETERYFVKADSRLLWRIFENILSNVSKYALPESRVYIDAAEQKDTIILTVKNISAYELNISADELMERFTRGDKSRNTEGSGLGLNIAESLAKLQYGDFHVEIDGDLFKSVLVLPKIKKKTIT